MTSKFLHNTFVVFTLLNVASAGEDTISCQVDSDCDALKVGFVCVDIPEGGVSDMEIHDIHGNDVTLEAQKYCVHKQLWPLTPKEWVGSIVFAFVMLLSKVGGIGGGGIAIPLAMYFFNLSYKPAIAISSFAIMVASLARFFFNWNERNPDKPTCSSIDYGMTIVMMPLTLVGSLIGAYFYKAFPDLILLAILTILLTILCWDSVKKFITMRKKEDEIEKKKNA
jgi:hypothetical protein